MGADLASLLYDDEPTARRQMETLAGILRRKQAVGTLASLIGGPAKDFGQALTSQADRGLAQLGDLPGQRLQMALGRQKVGAGEAEAAERARTLDPSSPRTQMGLQLLQRLGMRAPQGSTGADLEALLPLVARVSDSEQRARDRALARDQGKQSRADAAAARLEAQKAKQLESLVQKASKDTEEWSGQQDALATLEGAIDTKEGVGRLEGRLANWGLASDKAIQNRQAMATLGNAILRARSGAAVTPSEGERVAIETGMAPGASGAQFEAGARAIVAVLKRGAANTRAKYPQEAWDEISARGGTVPPSGLTAPPGGLPPEKQRRLEELRAKKAAGALR